MKGIIEMKSLSIMTIAILFIIIPIRAQLTDLKFQCLTTIDGLSHDNILTIIQDHKGLMWFGTEDGLNKYDGYQFTIYRNNPKDSTSLSGNYVEHIWEDSQKTLWIGTSYGLNKYERNKDCFITYYHDKNDPYSISYNDVTCIYEDSRHNLWIGTGGGGINLLNRETGKFTRYTHDENNQYSISDNYITCILEDHQNELYIGTHKGLNLFDHNKQVFEHFFHDPDHSNSLSADWIYVIYEDNDRDLWIGTINGLNLFNRKNKQFVSYMHDPDNKKSLSFKSVANITQGPNGYLWISTDDGLNLFDKKSNIFYRHYSNPNDETSISNNTILCVYRDDADRMWLGTKGGINIYDKRLFKFKHYKFEKSNPYGLNQNIVSSFAEDASGNIWIGTDGGGLNYFDKTQDKFFHYKHNKNKSSLTSDKVLSLMKDSRNGLWIGMWAGGVNHLNLETMEYTHYLPDPNDPSSLSSEHVFYLYEDRRNNLWVGTWGAGLELFDRKLQQFIHFPHSNLDDKSFSGRNVTTIFEDSKGNLWIGSEFDGLNRLDRDTRRFTHYNNNIADPQSISSDCIFSLNEDRDGRLLIGTNSGLNIFNEQTNNFTHIQTADGLPNDVVNCILIDDHGNIWMGTNKGLSKMTMTEENDSLIVSFRNYDIYDGLLGWHFNKWATLKSSNGEMYFGGHNGFNVFHPDSVKDNKIIPPVIFTDFQLFNKSVTIGGKNSPLQRQITETESITLSYKQSVFSFAFAALNYTRAVKNKYAYKMEGFDKDWIYSGNRREATYTNLNPGEYVFRVKGSNNDGVWNETGTSIRITVLPPWWKTWWFRSGLILFMGFAIFSVFQYRVRSIEAHRKRLAIEVEERTRELNESNQSLARSNAELEQFAYVASHDLQEPLRMISSYMGLVTMRYGDKLDHNGNEFIGYAMDGAKRMQQLICDLLSYSRVTTQGKPFEPTDVEKTYSQVLKNLEVAVEESGAKLTHDPLPTVKADPVQLDRLLQNLVGNAIKYRGERVPEVHVSAQEDEGGWVFSVADNGIGIDPKYHERIFGIFQRLHTREKYSGTGIGLAVCKKIVERHGGTIRVESEEGRGSIFQFTIPSSKEH